MKVKNMNKKKRKIKRNNQTRNSFEYSNQTYTHWENEKKDISILIQRFKSENRM